MGNIQSAQFVALIPAAFTTGVEVTLNQLFQALELPPEMSILEKTETVVLEISTIGLCIQPSINAGDFDSSRVMRHANPPIPTIEKVNADIALGESESVEFKSSYLFNRDQAALHPELNPQQLHFAGVMHATLKTICAFANNQGGTLLVGVNDNGQPIGIQADFGIVAPDGINPIDKWQLRLRQDIEGQFKDGKAINEYVSIGFAEFSPLITVARIAVLGRRRLTFLKREKGQGYCPYKRQGNRSLEIPYEDIEDFLSAKPD